MVDPMLDVIVPVYGNLDLVQRCLESVLRYPQKTPYGLVIIDDASPEADLSAYLDELASLHAHVTVIRNRVNQGFVASVNTGMRLNPKHDVLLLNSDTEVANDWIDRIQACALRQADIGTVTPFSNNATICSFPMACRENELPNGLSLAQTDRMFALANKDRMIQIPTGVGFCMYIKRACLDDVGLFDVQAFGEGYGEENDFCMRAAAKNWRHVLCADTYVYHRGAGSFGKTRDVRLVRAMQKLAALYPRYHRIVHTHIAEDAAKSLRANVLLQMIRSSGRATVLFITHHLGGGTEKHVRELAQHLSSQMDTVVLRPVENGWFSLGLGVDPQAVSLRFHIPAQYDQLFNVCRYLDVSRIHFHHTLGLAPRLWGLPAELEVPFDITLHDYYFVNANPTLTDTQGRFCENTGSRDDICDTAWPIPGGVSASMWRENQRLLLNRAERIFAPSVFTANLFREHYPDLAPIAVAHPCELEEAPYPDVKASRLSAAQPLQILVLGALSKEKGADLLDACAKIAQARSYPLEFHLMGYAYKPLGASVRQYGEYDDEHLPELIAGIAPHLVWFPAQWPETFSYTLSAAMNVGLPIACPDIGAFPERVARRPFTWVMPWKTSAQGWLEVFLEIRDQFAQIPEATLMAKWPQPSGQSGGFIYQKHYLPPPKTKSRPEMMLDFDWLAGFCKPCVNNGDEVLSGKEKLFLLALKGLRYRPLSALFHAVPPSLRRSVKRMFLS